MKSMLLMMAVLEEGTAEDWGAGQFPWAEWIGFGFAALLGVLLWMRVLTAFKEGGRYKALSVLDEASQTQLAGEIEKAEDHTSGEIAVVVVERSDRHPAAHWISGVLFVLVGSALLTQWLPWERPGLFFALQFSMGLLGMVLALALPGFRRGFITESRATEMATEQSLQEFYALGLQNTVGRTGVLLFVSLLERRVIVMGDEGIDSKVKPEDWGAVRDSVLDGVKAGELQAGLQVAVERIGKVLAEHFPVEGDNPNELDNHVIVRRE
jgi:putative membrane protein